MRKFAIGFSNQIKSPLSYLNIWRIKILFYFRAYIRFLVKKPINKMSLRRMRWEFYVCYLRNTHFDFILLGKKNFNKSSLAQIYESSFCNNKWM